MNAARNDELGVQFYAKVSVERRNPGSFLFAKL